MNFENYYKSEQDVIYTISGFSSSNIVSIESFKIEDDMPWWIEDLALSEGLTKSAAVVIQHKVTRKDLIVILGGKNKDQWSNRVTIIDPASRTLEELPPMPVSISGLAAAAVGNKIFAMGGNDGTGVQKRCFCFDMETDQWSEIASMNVWRDEVTATVGPEGYIYVIGGYGGEPGKSTCLNTVERYNFDKQIWEFVSPMNSRRRALASVSLPNGVYAIGGYGD